MYLVTSARLLLLYFALTLQNSIAVGQTPKAIQLADSLLRPGKYKAAITTYDFPNNIKQLQDKAIKNLKNNPKWADKYIVRLVEKGSAGIPKDLDAYGLTNEEFNSMLNAFKNRQMAIFSDTTSF